MSDCAFYNEGFTSVDSSLVSEVREKLPSDPLYRVERWMISSFTISFLQLLLTEISYYLFEDPFY